LTARGRVHGDLVNGEGGRRLGPRLGVGDGDGLAAGEGEGDGELPLEAYLLLPTEEKCCEYFSVFSFSLLACLRTKEIKER
jgi:hypothetical protein